MHSFAQYLSPVKHVKVLVDMAKYLIHLGFFKSDFLRGHNIH